MANFRYPGPICQTQDWYDGFDTGTLIRWRSPPPSTVGTTPGGTPSAIPSACTFIQPRMRGTVHAPAAAFERLRHNSGAATITHATPKTSQTWPDGTSSGALEQQITIDGQTIHVIRPTQADEAGKNLPSTAQLAAALRALPTSQRAHTRTVLLSPRAHPRSTPTATIAGEAGSGEITLFPVGSTQSQNDFDNRVMHESGHNLQGSLWNSGTAVAAWTAVATADGNRPSHYAANNTGDDFCEFGILYNTTKRTPCESATQQLYPHRWAKMESYLGNSPRATSRH
jgi:hypothetical protein